MSKNIDLYYLIKKCKENDHLSIITVINQFEPLINKYTRKLNYEDAKSDLTESLIKILYSIPLIYDEKILVGYISTSLNHTYISLSCKKDKYNKSQLLKENFNDIKVSDTFVDKLIIKNCINKLNDLQKKIIKYKFYFGYQDKEISKILGLSRQSIYKNKKKALQKLKTELLYEEVV